MRAPTFVICLVLVGCESHPEVAFRVPAVPSAPRLQSVEGRPESVDVTWLPNPPSEAVTAYAILGATEAWTEWSASLAGALSVSTGGCCTMSVSELDDETTYWFGLQATNEYGESLSALPISAKPPGWNGTQIVSTAQYDRGEAVAVDAFGAVYLAGSTYGDLGSDTNNGMSDFFVARFLADGTPSWVRLYGTPGIDTALALVVTQAGDLLLAGETDGAFPGESNFGGDDAVAILLEPLTGEPIWVSQLGTGVGDEFTAAVVSSNAAFLAGSTAGNLDGETNLGGKDAFLMRINLADGSPVWTELVGTAGEEDGFAVAIAPDASLFLCGATSGNLDGGGNAGSTDAFATRISSEGVRGWTEQFGTVAPDGCNGIAATADSVFTTGGTEGGLDGQTNSGLIDIFTRKMNSTTGLPAWTRLIGGPSGDTGVASIAVDDGVLIFGHGYGPANLDLVGAKISGSNDLLWETVYSSPGYDQVNGGAASPAGAMFFGGVTLGSLGGSVGDDAAFLVKFEPDGDVSEN